MVEGELKGRRLLREKTKKTGPEKNWPRVMFRSGNSGASSLVTPNTAQHVAHKIQVRAQLGIDD